ncbi:MAG: PA0069 family radical SAM protein [Gammaproteobacteria bacterium]
MKPNERPLLTAKQLKGRGAAENPSGRYEAINIEQLDASDPATDWQPWPDASDAPAKLQTRWRWETGRRLINRVQSPDIAFNLSINPYRGCEHGCAYCYARPSHAWLGLSAGIDFETRLIARKNAAVLLRQELSASSYRPDAIAIGFNTDAWQPLEKSLGITRSILEVLWEYRNPAAVISKATLMLRDLDLLADMARLNLVHASVSLTTLDARLNRLMEPRAASPSSRLHLIRKLSEAGIPVRVMIAPIIPGLTDHELEAILEQAASAGAQGAGYVLLRLPHELSELFPAWLQRHYPLRAGKVLAKLRRARDGKLYDSTYKKRMSGTGKEADFLKQRFDLAVKRLGLKKRGETIPELDLSLFQTKSSHPTLF